MKPSSILGILALGLACCATDFATAIDDHPWAHQNWRSRSVPGGLRPLGGGTFSLNAIGVPIGGYVPLVGFGLTDEFSGESSDDFLFAQPSVLPGGNWLSTTGSAHYDLALYDTGAQIVLLTDQARQDFGIVENGFDGTETISIGGATGLLEAVIEDPLGVYLAGLGDRTADGPLALNSFRMRGMTNTSVLSAPAASSLPNVIGLPVASQYATSIRSDQPQIFRADGQTIRTPQIEMQSLGSGDLGIRRSSQELIQEATIELRPGEAFASLPFYFLNINNALNGLPFSENPQLPTAVSGGMFLNVDLRNDGNEQTERKLLLDTGASVTAVSEALADDLGFDVGRDTPDFFVTITGSGGLIEEVPGFIADELELSVRGGDFILNDVPIIVLDITDPGDPGNIADGIIGTNVFVDRNITIDPNPSLGGGGLSPTLYISEPVTETHAWAATAATGNWSTPTNWQAAGTPDVMWVVDMTNTSGTNQEAIVDTDITINRLAVAGGPTSRMTVRIESGSELLTFGGTDIQQDGVVLVEEGAILDTQFIDLDEGGFIGGNGTIRAEFENRGGVIAPGESGSGSLTVEGVLANREGGTVEIEIGGTQPVSEHDQLLIDGITILGGHLEVDLIDAGSGLYEPQVGDKFTIVDATSALAGRFDSAALPLSANWIVRYLFRSVELEIESLAGLVGDFDADGDVDGDDFLRWQAGYAIGSTLSEGDADDDGDVDGGDFLLWQANYGSSGFGGGNVTMVIPEPSLLALTGILLAALLAARTRRPK